MIAVWDPVRHRMRYLPAEFHPLVKHVERLGFERLARRLFEKSPDLATLLRECSGE